MRIFVSHQPLRQTVFTMLAVFLFIFNFAATPLPALAASASAEQGGLVLSEEDQNELAEELTASPEAVKEQSIDLKAELGLPDNYNPIVPKGFFSRIGYGFKKAARNSQEGLYNTFASEESYARLVKNHSDKQLVEAAKLSAEAPHEGERVLSILKEYQGNLQTVKDSIPDIKKKNSERAKAFSTEVADDHMFVANKVLGSLQDNFLARKPELVARFTEIRNSATESAGEALISASDNVTEASETLNIIANRKQATPFSGIVNAEVLSTTKGLLANKISAEFQGAFDDVISTQLKTVEDNFNSLGASDEVKAKSFEKFVAQTPGASLERMKVLDQFRSEANLGPQILAKMHEAKARLAENIAAKIQNVVQEEIRKAVASAMLEIKNPHVDDFKILTEFKDLVPHEEIRKEIEANHEQQVQKFINKFSDDTNARQVTDEFQTLTAKVKAGEITPDANYFKALEGLKGRLSPDQQRYIEDMESTGRQEMANRMQFDPNFAARLSTFNPADVQIFEGIKNGVRAEFKQPNLNFDNKFREIEQFQADNFKTFLELRDRPEDVRAIKERFEAETPADVKQKFEREYRFDFEGEFKKHEQLAREKDEFLKQKYQEIEKQYQEKFGDKGPDFAFPGNADFRQGFVPPPFFNQEGESGKPRLLGPPIDANTGCPVGKVKGEYGCEFEYQKPQVLEQDPQVYCSGKGGLWRGSFCEFPNIRPETENRPEKEIRPENVIKPEYDPSLQCAKYGGSWNGRFCENKPRLEPKPEPVGEFNVKPPWPVTEPKPECCPAPGEPRPNSTPIYPRPYQEYRRPSEDTYKPPIEYSKPATEYTKPSTEYQNQTPAPSLPLPSTEPVTTIQPAPTPVPTSEPVPTPVPTISPQPTPTSDTYKAPVTESPSTYTQPTTGTITTSPSTGTYTSPATGSGGSYSGGGGY